MAQADPLTGDRPLTAPRRPGPKAKTSTSARKPAAPKAARPGTSPPAATSGPATRPSARTAAPKKAVAKKAVAEKAAAKKTSAKKATAKTAAPKPPAARPAAAAKPPAVQAELNLIVRLLDDDKAEDIVAIDVAGRTVMADALVIASGRSQRHVAAMAERLRDRLKAEGYGTPQIEGLDQADWVLIDAGDVIVHLFRPEVRTFYNLEAMWRDGEAPERQAV